MSDRCTWLQDRKHGVVKLSKEDIDALDPDARADYVLAQAEDKEAAAAAAPASHSTPHFAGIKYKRDKAPEFLAAKPLVSSIARRTLLVPPSALLCSAAGRCRV